jgi:anti-anti-sigma regulatory factor
MQQHLTRRVVLELDDIEVIEDRLLEQIIELNHLVRSHGGMLRLSGMSAQNRDALRDTRLDSQLPHYETRTHAIMTFHGAHRAR